MSVRIPFELIDPNPWQTRESYDEAYIADLAADIKRNGLMQAPAARLVQLSETKGAIMDEKELSFYTSSEKTVALLLRENPHIRFQLVFGHNRFQALCRNKQDLIPLEIRNLTDEQMALQAWSENAQRKDLNPVEEARAIQKRMEDFGWTQQQSAEHLGLHHSTVSNKLRILNLPAELLDRIVRGELSERQAMALLPLFSMDAPMARVLDMLPEIDWHRPGEENRVDRIVQEAIGGASSGQIRKSVETLVARLRKVMDVAKWVPPVLYAERSILEPLGRHSEAGVLAGTMVRKPIISRFIGVSGGKLDKPRLLVVSGSGSGPGGDGRRRERVYAHELVEPEEFAGRPPFDGYGYGKAFTLRTTTSERPMVVGHSVVIAEAPDTESASTFVVHDTPSRAAAELPVAGPPEDDVLEDMGQYEPSAPVEVATRPTVVDYDEDDDNEINALTEAVAAGLVEHLAVLPEGIVRALAYLLFTWHETEIVPAPLPSRAAAIDAFAIEISDLMGNALTAEELRSVLSALGAEDPTNAKAISTETDPEIVKSEIAPTPVLLTAKGIAPNVHGVYPDEAADERLVYDDGKKKPDVEADVLLLELADGTWTQVESVSFKSGTMSSHSGPLTARRTYRTRDDAAHAGLDLIRSTAENNATRSDSDARQRKAAERLMAWAEAQIGGIAHAEQLEPEAAAPTEESVPTAREIEKKLTESIGWMKVTPARKAAMYYLNQTFSEVERLQVRIVDALTVNDELLELAEGGDESFLRSEIAYLERLLDESDKARQVLLAAIDYQQTPEEAIA